MYLNHCAEVCVATFYSLVPFQLFLHIAVWFSPKEPAAALYVQCCLMFVMASEEILCVGSHTSEARWGHLWGWTRPFKSSWFSLVFRKLSPHRSCVRHSSESSVLRAKGMDGSLGVWLFPQAWGPEFHSKLPCEKWAGCKQGIVMRQGHAGHQ